MSQAGALKADRCLETRDWTVESRGMYGASCVKGLEKALLNGPRAKRLNPADNPTGRREMNIGQAASSTGMSVKMIRYYESIDLIQPHGRAESACRIYSDSDVHVLRFILQARTLGCSIERIRQLLASWRDQDRASFDLKAVALSISVS